MPNIVAHYICGCLVAKKLGIEDEEYLKGNLCPDYVDKSKHYRTNGKKFRVPDISSFLENEPFTNEMERLGFLTHLLLDKLFLDDFVINSILPRVGNDTSLFQKGEIYKDYSNMSADLLKHYQLNLDEIDALMLPEKNIDTIKYQHIMEEIRSCNNSQLKYINLDEFILFLDDSINTICDFLTSKKLYPPNY